ncbi:40057_t:CDS:2, partial [Gigaspora margarita]
FMRNSGNHAYAELLSILSHHFLEKSVFGFYNKGNLFEYNNSIYPDDTGAGEADIVAVGTAGGATGGNGDCPAVAEFAVVAGTDATGVDATRADAIGADATGADAYVVATGAVVSAEWYGFQDPKEWDYCYTIQNKSGEVHSLCMEHVKDSGCDGPWGTKSCAVKVGDLIWDCGGKDGFK